MNSHNIKAAINIAGATQVEIANHFKVSEAAVSGVIWGSIKSDRICRYIAKLIKKPVYHVFPQWYQKNHKEAA